MSYNDIIIPRKDVEEIIKDRLDFGFDSIYFRYSEVVEELSWYKEKEALRAGTNFNRRNFCEQRRMHFYNTLEQLIHAHPIQGGER